MENEKELRQMFGLPTAHPDVHASIAGDDSLDGILGVDLPTRKPKLKPRGKPWPKGGDNYNSVRWVCLQCGLESNIGGMGNHQKATGHVGKQRVFRELEKLGII